MQKLVSTSYALEDIFALYATGAHAGVFVDIGCSHPIIGNNSKLLESLGWKGIGIDHDRHPEWESCRTASCLELDATSVDYRELFRYQRIPNVVDFLSIDIDDACFDVVRQLPFDSYAFKVITIEHDMYRTPTLRNSERALLKSKGYELVCADVRHEPDKPFEDWWLNPCYFDSALIEKIRCQFDLDIDVIRRFGHRNAITRLYGIYGTYPRLEIA